MPPLYLRAVLVLLLIAPLPMLPAAFRAWAVQPDEMLADPAMEARARDIGSELRCLVCQNESIDESNADLARDLRRLVRERLQQGDSNRQVLDYIVSRYGDFVLLRPPLKPTTWVLWFGPPTILLLGGIALVLYFRRRARGAVPGLAGEQPLSAAELARLSGLIDGAGGQAGEALSPAAAAKERTP